MEYTKALILFAVGLAMVTLVNLSGAILASKYKVKHGDMVNVSGVVYFFMAFDAAELYPFYFVLLLGAILAVYETLIAFRLAIKLNPGFSATGSASFNIVVMIILSLIVSTAGFLASLV